MGFSVKVKLDLPKANEVIQACGLDSSGAVQQFHTQNVLRRIQKYMPYQSGALIKLTIAQTDINKPEIVTEAPQAAYLYYGKVMVDSVTGKGPAYIPLVGYRYKKGATLKETDRDLTYNQEKNPQAGPRWDLAVIAYDGAKIVAELQERIDRGK